MWLKARRFRVPGKEAGVCSRVAYKAGKKKKVRRSGEP